MARVDSPAWHLVKALDTLVADDGFTPTVDGWFENVRPLTPREKELLAASLPKDEEAVKKVLGVRHWIKDEDFLTSTYRLASQPTVNIQGLVSGYTGPGGKTVLPGRAEAKLDFRLVPDMTKDGGGRKTESASRQARLRRHRSDRQWRLQPDRIARGQRRHPGRRGDAGKSRHRVQPVPASRRKLARRRLHGTTARDGSRPLRRGSGRRCACPGRMAADREQ